MIKTIRNLFFPIACSSFLLLGGCTTNSTTPEAEANTEPEATVATELANVEPNDSNSYISDALAEEISNLEEDLLGKSYQDIWELAGTPYVKTYYVTTKDLAKEEIAPNMSSVAVYPIENSEENDALAVRLEKDKIVSIQVEEFNGTPKDDWKETDYVVNAYSNLDGSMVDETDFPKIAEDSEALAALKESYVGKAITDFQNKYHLIHGNNEAYNQDKTLKLDIYPILSEQYPSPIAGIHILTDKDGTIKDVNLGEPDVQFEHIEDYFIVSK